MLGILLNLAVKTDEYQHSCPVFHAEKTAWKHEKKLSGWMFWYDYMDLTEASGFNGVEQCEKCLSRYHSKVHHTTFILTALSVSPFLPCLSRGLLCNRMKCCLTAISTALFAALSTSYSVISLFIKLIKTQYIKARLPYSSRTSSFASVMSESPLRGSTHDMYYPHNHHYFNKPAFVFIEACLIVILCF